MAKPLPNPPNSHAESGSDFGPTTLFANLLEFQQHQWQTLIAWQQTMADMQQDLYDRWACQWADGARLND